MPADFGARALIDENYSDFLDSMRTLSRGQKENVRGGFGPSREFSRETPAIVMPGWNDVVILGPRQTVTRDDWRAYFNEQRTGTDARLSPATRVEIERRQRSRERMERSPTPGWAQEVGRALTALDNVQDLLSTVAVVGRLVVKPFPIVHPLVAIPLRLLTGAAAVVNVLGLIGMAASPLYGLLCAGPSEAFAAGMVSALKGRALKQLVTGAGKTARHGRTVARVSRTPRSLLPGPRGKLPALIEGAQVTKDLFGWGLSFGAVMGVVNDAAFGVEQAARGRVPQLRTPRDPVVYWQPLRALLARYPDDALDDLRSAAGVYAWAPLLLAPDSPLDDVEREQVLAAHYVATELLWPFARARAMPRLLELALTDQWTPPAYTWSATAESLALGGDPPPRDTNRWPSAPTSVRISGLDVMEQARASADAYWDALAMIPAERPERIALEMLTTRVMERAALAVLGDEHAIDWRLSTPFALAEGLLDAGLLLDVVSNPDGVERMAAEFDQAREQSGRVYRTRTDFVELATRHGVRVVELVEV